MTGQTFPAGAGRKAGPRRAQAGPTAITGSVPLILTGPAAGAAADQAPRAQADPAPGAAPRAPAPAGDAPGARARLGGPVLPAAPEADSPAAWGDNDEDMVAALRRDIPPHWS